MQPQRITLFAEIEAAFLARVREVIWCSAASVDTRGRPRSRVLHPVWEDAAGWVTTRRSTPKLRHLAANPHLSLAYIADPFRPVYVECTATWIADLASREHVWALCRSLPEPEGGFDPTDVWGDIEDPENGLLRLTPWRIEINEFRGPPQTTVWQASQRPGEARGKAETEQAQG